MRSGYELREPYRVDDSRDFAERREEEHARAAQLCALRAFVPRAAQLARSTRVPAKRRIVRTCTWRSSVKRCSFPDEQDPVRRRCCARR